MPNSGIEPQGKVTASATPFSMMSRTSGSGGLHVGAAEGGHQRGDGGMRGSDLHALDVAGHHDLLGLGVERAVVVHEAEAELDVLHLGAGVLAIPLVERLRAALGIRHHEGEIAGVDDGEAARLIARADVGDVGDAVARHVVVVEGLAELLRRKHGKRHGAVGGRLHRAAPVLQRLLQRMRRRHPVRQLQVNRLVLRSHRRSDRAHCHCSGYAHQQTERASCQTRAHLPPPRAPPGNSSSDACWYGINSARSCQTCKEN